MKRKILAVMLAGAMALQGGSWAAAAEEEILIVGESEGVSDLAEQDIPEMLEEKESPGGKTVSEEMVSAVDGAPQSGGEKTKAAEITIEGLDLAEDPGYVQIQEAGDPAVKDVEINAENFPDDIFREYVKQFDGNGNGTLEAAEIEEVTVINVNGKQIKDLKGIEFFKNLTELSCGNNELSSLDISSNLALETFDCSGNQLSSLDVSSNSALKTLYCCGSQLSSLDVSHNPFLEDLECNENELSSLDISSNSALKTLCCYSNQLSSLDISSNSALVFLGCGVNQLSGLDVSSNSALETLHCNDNQLGSLDLSNNPALKELSCSGNQLRSLDLSNNPALEQLCCYNNWLSSLDLSHNPAVRLDEFSYYSTFQVPAPVRSDGIWQMNLTDYVEKDNFDRVTFVSEGVSLSGEMVLFGSARPAALVYKYDTKALCDDGYQMEVTLWFLNDGECDVHEMVTIVDQEATCGTAGSQHQECIVCGYGEAPTEIPATGQHSYGDYVVTKEATEEEEGVRTRTCTVCGETESEAIPKLEPENPGDSGACVEHDMVTIVDQEATCGKSGSQHQECRKCGYRRAFTEIPATGRHSYGAYVVTKEATEEEEGVRTRTCTVCEATESEAIPKLEPENPGDSEVCTEHDMVTVVDQEATCGTAGSQHRKCTICGYNEAPTEIPATGRHSYGAYVVTKEATEEEEGVRTRTCAVCGETESEAIPKLEPGNLGDSGVCVEHDMVTVVDQEATCGTAGSQHRECKVCGYKEAPTEIPATGRHSFGAYAVTKAATVKKEGVRTRTCAICGATESEAIPKLVPELKVNAGKIPMQTGQTTEKLEVDVAKGDRIVSWKSSDKKIVKVTKDGKLKAQKKAGKAVVTVTLESGLTKKIQVTVQKKEIRTKKISGLPKQLTMQKGKKLTLEPVITPITSQDKVTYKSSNKKIATVSAKGVVKGKKAGTVKITVISGKKKVTVTVKVKNKGSKK